MIKLNTGNLNKKVDISQQRRNGQFVQTLKVKSIKRLPSPNASKTLMS